MGTIKEQFRDYKFTDARLVEIALEKIAFAERDATELATVGVDNAWVSDLNDSVLEFAAMPSDTVEAAEQVQATEEKNTDAENILDKMKELRSAAARAFGEDSTEYGRFGFKGLTEVSEAELYTKAMVANKLAITYAAPLATKGFDAADNTALLGFCTEYVNGLKNQKMEVGSRDNAQEARVNAGNEIYKQLEKELCEAGKEYWRTRSASKYNDYLIYNTISGNPLEQTVNFSIPGMTTITVIELEYRANRVYTITNNTANAFTLFLSSNESAVLGTPLVVNPNSSHSGVFSDLAPSGSFVMVQSFVPAAGSGSFQYEV